MSNWYVDSGVSLYLTTNRQVLMIQVIMVAHQNKMSLLCSEKVKITTSTDAYDFEVMVKKVLCGTSLPTNHLSVTQL